MAEETAFFQSLLSGSGQVVMYVEIFSIIAILGLIGFWIVNRSAYNKIIVVRSQTGNVDKIYMTKAKKIKKKDGTEWWYIERIKKEAQIPPKDAIDLTEKGKEFAVCTLTPNGDIIWHTKDKQTVMSGLSSSSKAMLAYQFLNAGEWKKKSMSQWVMELAPWVAITIIVIGQLVFWGEYMKPAIELGDQQVEFSKLQNEQLRIIQNIDQHLMKIEAETPRSIAANGTPPQ